MSADTRYPFDPQHARTVALICCDGRLVSATMAFLGAEGEPRPDLCAIPGGALALVRSAETFQDRLYALRRLRTLIESHRSERLVLVAHAGNTAEAQCTLARLIRPDDAPDALKEWVASRLAEVARDITGEFPSVSVQAYLALVDGEGVSFVPVAI